VSQSPGEPESDGASSADKPDEPVAKVEPAEPDPELTRTDSSSREDAPPSGAEVTTTAAKPDSPADPATAPGSGGQPPPWWSQGQTPPPPPPGGQPPYQQQPPPYQQPYQQPYGQQAPAPWGYAQQAPPGPPPTMSGWSRGAAPVAAGDRDRLLPHLVWEGLLAVVAIALLVAAATTGPHQNLTVALGQAGYFGLLACGLALSMRTGSPNLAIGFILFFSMSLSADLITGHGWSKPAAFLVAILLSTLIGLVLGVLVAVLSVPSWAVTIGAGAVIQGIVLGLVKGRFVPVHFTGDYPTALWFGLFFVLSVGGGALWLVPAVRRPLSAVREPGDPARWHGLRTGLGAIVGLTGSSFLAGLAAVPMLMRLQASTGAASGDITFALGAVLLGGVSLFGRRAGVFGTFLAVTILAVTQTLIVYHNGPVWLMPVVIGLAALAGAGVSRAVEGITGSLNRSRPAAFTANPAGAPPPPTLPGR
jgi:ribose/xylose/arabinose/galactoside ABC-type transport system permease subunit